MFGNLSQRLENVVSKIKGYGKITEDNISEMLREIRLALLESDVNIKIVKEFTQSVKEKALGEEVSKSVKPGELFVKILKDELVSLLGEDKKEIITNKNFIVTMMCGLQGSGKTTTTGKMGVMLRKKYKRKVLFVACDVYRPGAIDQLKEIGASLSIEVFSGDEKNPVEIAKNSILYAKEKGYDYVLIDTAGRLQIDDVLMNELINIDEAVKCDEILLVLDAMMGQDAINVINGFNEKLKLTGCVLTKMDGDTKGGVALSLRHLTHIPIKLVGDSEKLDGLSSFDPIRTAERILGMGDILSIIEKTEGIIDEEEAKNQVKKYNKGKFDLNDFLYSFKTIKKMGPLENVLKMLPGAGKLNLSNVKIDPKDIAHIEAIILSMTPFERGNPDVLKATRKIRIAKGSGRSVEEVNRLLKQYEQMKIMMKQMKSGNLKMPF
ncbi:MAG: signal recognition particle protein [Bacilli bacterium]